MNKLSCQVESCNYNAQGGCCLDHIKVEGPAANCSEETVCGSYTTSGGANNACGGNKHTPKPDVDVGCSADVCCYNKQGKCEADAVAINCNCGCGDRSECSTFRL